MATSGTCQTNAYEGRYIQVSWSLSSQNVSGCYSTINYTVSAAGGSGWFMTGPVTVTFGGQIVYSLTSRVHQYAGILATGSIRVNHNTSNGAGSLSASIKAAIYTASVNCTGSGSWDLPTIARGSEFTVSPTTVTCGSTATFTISPYASGLNHKLRYQDDEGWRYIMDLGVDVTSYTWTVPASLIAQHANATSFTLPLECVTYSGSTYVGVTYKNITATIPTSNFTLSSYTVACGSTTTFTISSKSTALSHHLYYKTGSTWYSITALSSGSLNPTYTWEIPPSLANGVPNATSGNISVKVDTINGSTYVGSKTVGLQFTVPESYKPTITSLTITDNSSAVTTLGIPSGYLLKTQSQLTVHINTSSTNAHSATITKYNTNFEYVNYSGQEVTLQKAHTAGTDTVTSTITDSRGRTDTKTLTYTVIDYATPSITLSVQQSGSTVTCTLNGKVYPVTVNGSNLNTKTLTLRWRRSSRSTWEDTETIVTSDWSFNQTFNATIAYPDEAYVFEATLTDKLQSTTVEAKTGIVCISRLAGGKGVTLFQEATQEGFWINDIRYSLTDAEYTELSTLLGGAISSLSDWFYPVGAVVASTKAAFNPNNIYHGTWQRIAKGKTLVGVNEDDTDFATGKKTGGEKTHTLTVSEMPEHGGHLRSGTSVYGGDFTSKYLKSSVLSSYGAEGRGWDSINGGEAYPARISIGGNSSHNNMQPYYTVYYWERTA